VFNLLVKEFSNVTKKPHRKLVRSHELAQKVIIVDGFPGCGKTMLSPIIASLDRVEIANYAFEVEFICRAHDLGGMDHDAAVALIRMLMDGRLYTNMMGRDVNFRYSDISSVFNSPKKWTYFKRIFGPGDEAVPALIESQRPILNFNTHDLCQVAPPLFEALGNRLVFINVVRHPLFMVIQQTLNMEKLVNNARDIQVHFEYHGAELPYYTLGWEDLFLKSNPVERAIYTMHYQERARQQVLKEFKHSIGEEGRPIFIEIPFEHFVKEPEPYLEQIYTAVGTTSGKKTSAEMRRQRVPRINIVDGIPLSIYKRCGWVPPEKGLSEAEEYEKRKQFVVEQGASNESLETLTTMCQDYDRKLTQSKAIS